MTLTLTTYQELADIAESFARGALNLIIVTGEPGLGKSRAFKAAVDKNTRIIEGQLTAFQLYKEIWVHRDEPIVIDDVDKLYLQADCVRLLKLLCQTEPVKTVQWNTATTQLDLEGIPRSFETRSPVCIIANEFKHLNPNTKTIASRG